MCHNALAYPHRKHFMCTAEFIDSLFVFVAVVQVQLNKVVKLGYFVFAPNFPALVINDVL